MHWLDGAEDLALTRHAYGIVEKHFGPAGLPVHRAWYDERVPTWSNTCWYITRFLLGPIAAGAHDDVVRATLAELVDLVGAAPDTTDAALVRRLTPLLWEHAEQGVLPARVLALLPPKALAVMPALATLFLELQAETDAHEDELLRMSQHGY